MNIRQLNPSYPSKRSGTFLRSVAWEPIEFGHVSRFAKLSKRLHQKTSPMVWPSRVVSHAEDSCCRL
jgi:hypothetical protein